MIDIVFHDDVTGELIPLVLDATPTEQHRAGSAATEQEVEAGVAVGDHVRPQRRMITIEAIISDTPVRATAALGLSLEAVDVELPARQSRGKDARFEGGRWQAATVENRAAPWAKLQVWQPDAEVTRVADSWRVLTDARERSLLATLTTRFETYTNMALIDLVVSRTVADGSQLRAELTFAELRLVETEFVDDPVPARARDRKPVDRGSVETVKVERPEVVQSALLQTYEAAENFVSTHLLGGP